MKCILNLILLVMILAVMPSCGNNRNSSESTETDLVEVRSSDRTIQSYIPEPSKAFINRGSLTFDDMVTSSRLLLSSNGSLKGIEMSDGYHEIVSYRCFPMGGNFYFVECEYLDDGQTNGWECYVKEQIN